jgi:16S rRNA C1402 (ribose-2'-O) methylase RsmI
MNWIPADTTIEAARKQFEILKNMTGEQHIEIAFELTDKARQELIADIKKQNRDFTDQQVKLEIIRRCYGEKLAQEVAAAKGWK